MAGPRIALIGNCQVQTFSLLLTQMLPEVPDIRVFDYSQPYSRDEARRLGFAESLGDTDFIFAQTALLSHTSEQDLRVRYGSRVTTIANFYFRGLFPDSCYVGDFETRLNEPSLVHSILVLDAFRRGLNLAAARRAFDLENIDRLGLMDAWASSMTEMRRREGDASVDVPAADLLEEACRSYPAFLTMNHPGVVLLSEYLHAVLRHVDLPTKFMNPLKVPDPLAVHDTTPILDEVAEHYELPYRTSQRWKINALQGRHVDREEYVSVFYATYRSIDPARLVVHSPTDLVARLRNDPALRYLVDPAAPVPDQSLDEASAVAAAPSLSVLRAEVTRAIRPLAGSIEELRVYTHKVHSFLEVVDPKVERLVQEMPRLRDVADAFEADRAVRTRRWRRVRVGLAAAVALVVVGGAVFGTALALGGALPLAGWR